ncbi:hypothetical protein HaLaN_17671 [Haematococcus lacustris]|uniref:Uncharacterized protein n=1 Tax=Haematococcus lacustris TaxID=44745 RepID=A0A699ZD42_HAELA|nr:hypothetical protein HaLaN_17671 [Haematococcus lacustris]
MKGGHVANTLHRGIACSLLLALGSFWWQGGLGRLACIRSVKRGMICDHRLMCDSGSLSCKQLPSDVQKVIAYCKKYTREGMIAAAGRFFLYMWHKEEFEALATELHGLTAFASLALGVINTRMIEDAKDKVNTGMPPVARRTRTYKTKTTFHETLQHSSPLPLLMFPK